MLKVTVKPIKMSDAGRKGLSSFKAGFFNRQAVLDALDEAERVALMKAGALTRKIAQRSMRRRKKASLPGQPPSARTDRKRGGLLRDLLFFAYDAATRSVVIGPASLGAGRAIAPGLHEFGGSMKTKNPRRRVRGIGHGGPVRLGHAGGGKTTKLVDGDKLNRYATYIRLESQAQVDRAHSIEEALYGPLVLAQAKYPPRPYMGPALAEASPEVVKLWRNAVKA